MQKPAMLVWNESRALEDAETEEIAPIFNTFTKDIFLITNYGFVIPAVACVGIVVNIFNLIVYAKMGFVETINISLFALAISDICSLVTQQGVNFGFNPLIINNFDPRVRLLEVANLSASWPHMTFTKVTGLITAYISFERCLCVTLPLKVKAIVGSRRRTVAIVFCAFVLMIIVTLPVYTYAGLGWKFDVNQNRTVFGTISVGGPELWRIVFAVHITINYVTVVIVLLCTLFLIRALRNKSQWREKVASVSSENSIKTKESTSVTRSRKVVKMVTTIAALFVTSNIPLTLLFIVQYVFVPEFRMLGAYRNINMSMYSFSYLFETVNSSINFFIYLKMSSKFRETFLGMFCESCRKDKG